MNSIDATEHYETSANDPAPSLLTVILDTNPHAWALLEKELPLAQAVANILVFLNAHLACNYVNEVAVVASHSQKATWLYPSPSQPPPSSHNNPDTNNNIDQNGDTPMTNSHPNGSTTTNGTSSSSSSTPQTNKYRPFRIVEEQVTSNLHALMNSTTPTNLAATTSTMMAGALTLALSHINRRSIAWSEAHGGDTSTADTHRSSTHPPASTSPDTTDSTSSSSGGLQSRILIISVSSSTDSAHQYIPIMNGIFACQRLRIPIDVAKLSGDAVFLQQASDATKGIFMSLSTTPRGLLQYLMMSFLPDQRLRRHLVLPTTVDVDFRAACFCHRRVVDVGFVCSICLSIFCEPPDNGDCLTCGTHLEMGEYGAKPALVMRKMKKKKKAPRGVNGGGVASQTPTPTPTPGP